MKIILFLVISLNFLFVGCATTGREFTSHDYERHMLEQECLRQEINQLQYIPPVIQPLD